MSNREQHIQEIAYRLWEQEGRPDGHSERLWLAAEAQFEADKAKSKYEAEVAKDRAQPAGEMPARPARRTSDEPRVETPQAPSAKPKTAEPPVEMPQAPSAKVKAADPPIEKKPRAAKPKTAEPAAKKPADPSKRRPGDK